MWLWYEKGHAPMTYLSTGKLTWAHCMGISHYKSPFTYLNWNHPCQLHTACLSPHLSLSPHPLSLSYFSLLAEGDEWDDYEVMTIFKQSADKQIMTNRELMNIVLTNVALSLLSSHKWNGARPVSAGIDFYCSPIDKTHHRWSSVVWGRQMTSWGSLA